MIRFIFSVTIDLICIMMVLSPFFVDMGLGLAAFLFLSGLGVYTIKMRISKFLRNKGF